MQMSFVMTIFNLNKLTGHLLYPHNLFPLQKLKTFRGPNLGKYQLDQTIFGNSQAHNIQKILVAKNSKGYLPVAQAIPV